MAEKKQDNKDSKFKGFSLYWLYGLIVVGLIAANFMDTTPMSKEIAYNEIKSLIEKKAVEEIRVISNKNIAEIILLGCKFQVKRLTVNHKCS